MRPVFARVVLAGAILALVAPAFAQLPPGSEGVPAAGQRAGGRRAGAPEVMNNEQVFRILDSFVMANAQRALQLNDSQWSAFFLRMQRLQDMQRLHRRQRQMVLNQLKMLIGPRAQQAGMDDAAVAAKTKELDDLDMQIKVDEQKAVGEIDQVLQVQQRAHFRVFLDNMERQKLDLLMRARQGARSNTPGPAPGRGQ
jgi:hypothetical protein